MSAPPSADRARGLRPRRLVVRRVRRHRRAGRLRDRARQPAACAALGIWPGSRWRSSSGGDGYLAECAAPASRRLLLLMGVVDAAAVCLHVRRPPRADVAVAMFLIYMAPGLRGACSRRACPPAHRADGVVVAHAGARRAGGHAACPGSPATACASPSSGWPPASARPVCSALFCWSPNRSHGLLSSGRPSCWRSAASTAACCRSPSGRPGHALLPHREATWCRGLLLGLVCTAFAYMIFVEAWARARAARLDPRLHRARLGAALRVRAAGRAAIVVDARRRRR